MKKLWLTLRRAGPRLYRPQISHRLVLVCLVVLAGGAGLVGVAVPAPVVAAGLAAGADDDERASDPAPAHGALPAAGLNTRMTPADARHLLQRTGLGSSLTEVQTLAGLTRQQGIDHLLAGLGQAPPHAMPDWAYRPAPAFWTQGDLLPDQRRLFRQQRHEEMRSLQQWWLSSMLETTSPQTERLMLFWHDHFATSFRGINNQSIAMARQHRLFRALGTGSFRRLLKAIIRDPAMLNYLDAASNRKGNPNENLGRELLERFTLGEGHYDEKTVKQASRALTGYRVNTLRDLSFEFLVSHHDESDKTLFGQTAAFDGDALIDIILEQPQAARFLATRFWHAYIADAAPDRGTVDHLAKVLRQSDYDVATLYRALLESDAFWAPRYRAALVKSPVHLLVGLMRTVDYALCHAPKLPGLMKTLGMELFYPPNVSGWTEGAAFVTPGRLLNRHRATSVLLKPCKPEDQTPAQAPGKSASPTGMMVASGLDASAPGMSPNNDNSGTMMMAADDDARPGTVIAKKGRLPMVSPGDAVEPTGLSVSAVRLRNAAQQEASGKWVLVLDIQDLAIVQRRIDTLQIRVQTNEPGPMTMQLSFRQCWPDCVMQWPECSHVNPHDPRRRSVSFPLVPHWDAAPARLRCQYAQLNESDKRLIDTLWVHLSAMLQHVKPTDRGIRLAEGLSWWESTLAEQADALANSVYARRAGTLKWIPDEQRQQITPVALELPAPTLASIDALENALGGHDVQWSDLLTPGAAFMTGVVPESRLKRPLREQLRWWLEQPAFQVY